MIQAELVCYMLTHIGDSYDNALAETIIDLFKKEIILIFRRMQMFYFGRRAIFQTHLVNYCGCF